MQRMWGSSRGGGGAAGAKTPQQAGRNGSKTASAAGGEALQEEEEEEEEEEGLGRSAGVGVFVSRIPMDMLLPVVRAQLQQAFEPFGAQHGEVGVRRLGPDARVPVAKT